MSTTWVNWGRSAVAHPSAVLRPSSTEEVVELVREAAAVGRRVKAVGSGHSFTSIAATDGVMVEMTRMTRVLHADAATGRVRVEGGLPLRELNRLLDALGLALPNLGDIDHQTITGAVSTGTHGTGGRLHGISKAVVGVRLVTGTGEVLDLAEGDDLFGAARVSLGALGVVTEVVLQCVPAFLLHAREEPMALDAVWEGLDDLVDGNDHFELYWWPHTRRTSTKRNNRVPAGTEPRPVSRARHLLEDEVLSNGAFGAICRVGTAKPSWVPAINRLNARALSAREFTDRSHEVFCSPRRVRFREMEYAVPREAVRDVVEELAAFVDRSGLTVSFPVEIRFTAADDVWMSTGHERDNAYVAVHQYVQRPFAGYFAGAEDIFTAYEGRPHWGKIHTRDAAYLGKQYARFDDFLAARDRLDPERTFANAYLDRVLGP
ncbi:D-arabinono-1,4-lactone oxidase [Aeromicrobium sp. IC_218]|uniref:D-arabinono-1,4-lactone oxidase n=1 Tax=Aeromicrobium sp. IC_218 TaxID=2545468 RepID=UPI00103B46C1|nr:D-arabinono-1,4-lactone oxidase [Aeromicrobium sp. IC_218]TCI99073.1 FAD-binding protein [Aeromicrobium sp. IC_218]